MLKLSLLTVLFVGSLTCGAQNNLVKNGDFTDGAKNWGGSGNGKAEIRKGTGREGGGSLLISNPDEKRTVRTQRIVAPPGVYNVSGYVKSDSVNTAEIRLIFYSTSDDKYIIGGEIGVGTISGSSKDWKRLEANVNVKEGTYFNLWLSVSGTGSAEFSDIKVEAGEKKNGNLLRNSSFKQCSNPDTPDYWGILGGFQFRIPDWDTGKYFSIQRDVSSPEPGTDVLKLSGSAERNMFLVSAIYMQKFPGKYTFSLYACSEKELTPLEFGWIYRGFADSKQGISVGKEWKRHSFTYDLSEVDAAKNINLSFAVLIPKGESVFIAAPQLERGDTMTAYSESLFDKNIGAACKEDKKVPVNTFSIPKTNSAPLLDGLLNDECWKTAFKFGDFVDNGTGKPAKTGTNGWICADEDNIYLAFRCTEPDMGKFALPPPKYLYSGDNLEIFIQAGMPGNTYHRLAVSPYKKQDSSIGLNGAWDVGELDVGVKKESDFWMLEIAIPLKKLKIGDNSMWGFNFGRFRKDVTNQCEETSVWNGPNGYHNSKAFASANALSAPNTTPESTFQAFSELTLYPTGVKQIVCKISGADTFDRLTVALRNQTGAGGLEAEVNIPPQGGLTAIPAEKFKPGNYELVAKGFKAGKEVASFMDSFNISSGRELVGQNKFLRCLTIGGKPFFPIGFLKEFYAPDELKEWQYAAIKEKGFNTIIAISRKGNEALQKGDIDGAAKYFKENFDIIAKQGFKIIWWLHAGVPSKDLVQTLAAAEKIENLIERFKDYSGIIGWYVADEPDKANVSDEALQKYYQTIKKSSADCPVFINYNWCGINEGSLPVGGHGSTDLMFLDVYPFSDWGIDAPLEKYAYSTWLGNKIAAERSRTQMMWLQTYGYCDGLREPNAQEYENMVWQSLIFGTRGLACFTERPMSKSLWEREGVVHAKIKKMEGIMFANDFKGIASPKAVKVGVNHAIWSSGGKYYLLFANQKYESFPFVIDLKTLCGREFKTAEDFFGGDKIEIKNGILNIQAAPAATGTYIIY